MTTRLPILLCALALTAAACGSIPEGEVVSGEGARFVPFVAEFLDDSGLGNAIAVDAEGVPYTSYWIFPGTLAEGEIPVGRPLGSPYITTGDPEPKDGAAIGVASLSTEDVWTRGAAAQVRETPAGVTIPFGPAKEDSLVGATARNTNGTDIAIDAAGAKHVVWTGPSGVFYAGGTDSFAVEQVYGNDFNVRAAGPIGPPSVAADADGIPWVAYMVEDGGNQVLVATRSGERWRTQTVATRAPCSGCPPPGPAPLGVTAQGPMVAWIDAGTGAVMASTLQGGKWVATQVASGSSPQGLDMAVDADGQAVLSFYDGDGAVQVGTSDGSGWIVTPIAEASPTGADTAGNLSPMTSVAIDDEGGIVAAWDDTDGVVVATSDDGETFTPLETDDTVSGRSPSVGVSPDGATIYVAWYDERGQNLRFGVQGKFDELAVAAPSPTADPGAAPAAPPEPTGGGGECGSDADILLDIEAQAGNVFSTDCLVAAAGEPFTIAYSNSDLSVGHNIHVYTEPAGDSIAATDILTGPLEDPLDVEALDEASYFFQCDAHPTTMIGTLAAVKVR